MANFEVFRWNISSSINLLYLKSANDLRYVPIFFFKFHIKNFRRYAGIPDFLTADDMEAMVCDQRLDPKMIFSYVQEVYRMCNEM